MSSRRLVIAGTLVLLLAGLLLARHYTETPPVAQAGASSAPLFLAGTPAGDLSAYLQGDFEGERLQRATWSTKYSKLVLWTNEPLWDSAYVIRAFHVNSGKLSQHAAQAEATFETLGELSLETYEYERSPSRQTVTYELTRDRSGPWKIALPTLRPHVGPEAAIAHLQRMAAGFPAKKAVIDKAIATIKADARTGAAP